MDSSAPSNSMSRWLRLPMCDRGSMPHVLEKSASRGLYGSSVARNGVALQFCMKPLLGFLTCGIFSNGRYSVHRTSDVFPGRNFSQS